MRKDPTEFRERFKKWQSGLKVYEAGLPRFKGGKEGDNSPIPPFEPMSMADIGDFEVKGNDAPVGEALKAKEPIAAPGMALSPDAQKRLNVELAIAKRFAFTKGQKNNISPEQYWLAYKNSAGFRTRWSRGMGQNNDDLFYKLGYNNLGVVNIRKNTEEGGSFYSPATRTVYFNPTSEGIMMLGGENEIRQHELNHLTYNSKLVEESKKYAPQTAPINKYNNPQAPVKQRSDWRRAVESKTGNVIDWSHDGNISEGGADAGALGMSLYQDGVFNRMDPNARITKDELNKWHEGFKKKNGGIGHRFIETYGTDRAVDLLNNTASLNTQKYDPGRLALAKYGLEKFNLPKCKDGKESGGSFPVNLIRQTLYKNVSPLGGYSIKRNIKDFGDYDPYNVSIDDIEADPNVSNEIWAEYLKIPYTKRHETGKKKMIVDSKYKPGNSKENIKYKAIKLDNSHKDRLVEDTDDLAIGKSKNSEIFADYNLGVHTVGRGVDKDKGEYRSYYDRWDLNPFNGKYEGVRIPKLEKIKDITMGIGTPLEIYDRLYLNDYYKVNPKDVAPEKGDFYGGYLPEIVIHPEKKDTSWDIYRQ